MMSKKSLTGSHHTETLLVHISLLYRVSKGLNASSIWAGCLG